MCFFQQNIGSVESLIKFYFNTMYCYHNAVEDVEQYSGWYCRIPYEWETIIDKTSASDEMKEKLKKWGIPLSELKIGEFVDYKYHKSDKEISDADYITQYEKDYKNFRDRGGTLLEVTYNNDVSTTKINIEIKPIASNNDFEYLAQNLFSETQNLGRVLSVPLDRLSQRLRGNLGKYFNCDESKSNDLIPISEFGSDTKYSLDPGSRDERVIIYPSGLNSVDISKRTIYITCNRFRTLFDIIMGSALGGGEYLLEANSQFKLVGDINYDDLYQSKHVTAGSGFLPPGDYTNLTGKLREKLYGLFIDDSRNYSRIRKVNDTFNCGLKTPFSTSNIQYIFCDCAKYNGSAKYNSSPNIRMNSLEQLESDETQIRTYNILNGIKNFTGIINVPLETTSKGQSNGYNEEMIASVKQSMIGSSLRNIFFGDTFKYIWEDNKSKPDNIIPINFTVKLFKSKERKFTFNVKGPYQYTSTVKSMVYKNYYLTNNVTSLDQLKGNDIHKYLQDDYNDCMFKLKYTNSTQYKHGSQTCDIEYRDPYNLPIIPEICRTNHFYYPTSNIITTSTIPPSSIYPLLTSVHQPTNPQSQVQSVTPKGSNANITPQNSRTWDFVCGPATTPATTSARAPARARAPATTSAPASARAPATTSAPANISIRARAPASALASAKGRRGRHPKGQVTFQDQIQKGGTGTPAHYQEVSLFPTIYNLSSQIRTVYRPGYTPSGSPASRLNGTSIHFRTNFENIYKIKEHPLYIPAPLEYSLNVTLPTYEDIYKIVDIFGRNLYGDTESIGKKSFVATLTKALFSVQQIIYNSPIVNIKDDPKYNNKPTAIEVTEDGKYNKNTTDYNTINDIKKYKDYFSKIILRAMVEAREYTESEKKQLYTIINKIGTKELTKDEKKQLFMIGKNKKNRIIKCPILDLKELLQMKINNDTTLLKYISRKLDFSYCLGTIKLKKKNGDPYDWDFGKQIPSDIYDNLDTASKIIGIRAGFKMGYNSEGIIIPTQEEDSTHIDKIIIEKKEAMNKYINNLQTLNPANIEASILKYCQKQKKEKFEEEKINIKKLVNQYLTSTDEIAKLRIKNNILEKVISKFKKLQEKIITLYKEYEIIKNKKKQFEQRSENKVNKHGGANNLNFLTKSTDADMMLIRLRHRIIDQLNNTLLYVSHLLLYIKNIIANLKNLESGTNAVKNKIRKKLSKIFGLNNINEKFAKRLLMKNKYSIFTLERNIIIASQKFLPTFDLEGFMKSYFPTLDKLSTENLIRFILYEQDIIQEELDKLMKPDEGRKLKSISGLKKQTFGVRDIGLWIPSILTAPIASTGFVNSKLRNSGIRGNTRSKLILYNLFSGEIIPCLNRSTNNEVLITEKRTNIKKGIRCFDFVEIKDPRELIQYTISKNNFNGIIVMRPSQSSEYKYMQLFADKLVTMKGKVKFNLTDFLESSDVRFHEMIKSNLELFFNYYVKDEEYKTNSKKHIMPIAIGYGKEVAKDRLSLQSKYKVVSGISDWDSSTTFEPKQNKEAFIKLFLSWATRGKTSETMSRIKSDKSFKTMSSHLEFLFKSGYYAVTGQQIKNLLGVIYDNYIKGSEFKLSDFDRLMQYVHLNHKGGNIRKLNKEIKMEEEINNKIDNYILNEIEKKTKNINLHSYYLQLVNIKNK